MEKYKVYYDNDPKKETIFCVEATSLDEAIKKACSIKNLNELDFLSIFSVSLTSYSY